MSSAALVARPLSVERQNRLERWLCAAVEAAAAVVLVVEVLILFAGIVALTDQVAGHSLGRPRRIRPPDHLVG